MKRTRTRFGPDATLSSLIEEWFYIKKYKGRNGYTDHWVCKRCPGNDPVHQSLCTSQGTRKRAHILGGKFAAFHRIKGCEGIDKEERKQLMSLYTSCMRHSRKFDAMKGAEEDPNGGFNFSFKKKSKKTPVDGFYCGIESWDLGDEDVSRPPKKRKIKQDEDGRPESSDDDVDDEGFNKAAKEQRRENRRKKQLMNSFYDDDDDDVTSFNRVGRNFLHGMYQVPVVEVRDPATDFQNFRTMLGFYVYLIATQPSEKQEDKRAEQEDKPAEQQGEPAEQNYKSDQQNDEFAVHKDGS